MRIGVIGLLFIGVLLAGCVTRGPNADATQFANDVCRKNVRPNRPEWRRCFNDHYICYLRSESEFGSAIAEQRCSSLR